MSKSQIYGVIGSAVACVLVLLLLLFVYMGTVQEPEDEGIMVSFGDTETGAGYGEKQETVATPVAPLPTPSTPSNNDLMTQDEESLALQEQRKEDARKKAEQAELQRKQREEQARLEAERIAKEKAEAERQRKEQEAIDNASKLGGLFGSNQGSTGTGNTTGNTREGNPAGQGTSGGHSWSLNGRDLQGKLTEPSYENNVEGTVVVVIRVNEAGAVISATVGAGTTISDTATRNAAMRAAKTAKFTTGKNEVSGTITYKFKLK